MTLTCPLHSGQDPRSQDESGPSRIDVTQESRPDGQKGRYMPEDRRGELVASFARQELSRRHFVQRALLLGFSVSGAGALLAACENSSPKAGGSPAPRASGKELRGKVQVLVGFGTGNAPEQVAVQQSLANAFTRQHPGVTIEFLRVPSSSDARTKLTVLIAGGQPPDLVMPAGLFGISLFVDQNIWRDLGPLL